MTILRYLKQDADDKEIWTGGEILDPAKPQDSACDKCTDERKDQPVLGMAILRYVKQDAHDVEIWTDGEILDPDNGKPYRARLKTLDGGRKLQVRGYLGPFYRTQVWQRVE